MSGFMRLFGRICSCFTLLNQSVTMLLLDLESVTAKLQLLSIRHLAFQLIDTRFFERQPSADFILVFFISFS